MPIVTFTQTIPGVVVKGTQLPVVRGLEAVVPFEDASRLVAAGFAVMGAHAPSVERIYGNDTDQ